MSLQAKGRVYLYKRGLKGGYTKEGGRGSKGRRCVWVCDMENRHVGGEIVNNNTTQQSSNQTQGCRRLTTQLRGDLKHVFLSSVFNQYFGIYKNIQKVQFQKSNLYFCTWATWITEGNNLSLRPP